MSEAMRRQWLWALAFHIKRSKGKASQLRAYIKLAR